MASRRVMSDIRGGAYHTGGAVVWDDSRVAIMRSPLATRPPRHTSMRHQKSRRAVAAAVVFSWTAAVAPPAGTAQAPAPSPAAAKPCAGCGIAPEPRDHRDLIGWTRLFDGATLDGWDGNPAVWKVEDGAITAESTAERRVGSTFLIWKGGEPADFELKLEMKTDRDIHSGVFYRSAIAPLSPRPAKPPHAVPADPKWNVTGYGVDFDYDPDSNGNVQDTGGRKESQIGWRGFIVRMEPGQRPRAIGSLGDRDALMKLVKVGDWNEIHVIARGNQLTHILNGQVMAVLVDDDAAMRKARGVIALQIEQWGTGKVHFRNIWLKQ